jgi:hypothetical protein
MADTGTQPITTGDSVESLSSTAEDTNLSPPKGIPPHDWLAPLLTSEEIRRRRHTDASQDPKYNH